MFFRLLLILACGIAGIGCGAVSTEAGVSSNDTLRRYHDGKRWVELRVVLDRLQLERVGTDGRIVAREAYLLRTPVRSVAELDAVATQVAAAQRDIAAVSAYVADVENPGEQPLRLTHQVAVKGGVISDIESVLARHGARVVDHPSYDPDLLICAAERGGVLAAFVLADALRQQVGVVLAIPLIERPLTNHAPPVVR
jgi:hypothetical protein